MLEYLYRSVTGRFILKLLTAPAVSRAMGAYMDSGLSRPWINGFIKKNAIEMNEAKRKDFASFNDFFTRQLKEGARPLCTDENALISPCDAALKVCPVSEGVTVTVKDVPYTIDALLKSRGLARMFEGGQCLIFRLSPRDYHRYIFPADGRQLFSRKIAGVLHTVRPVATEKEAVFVTNTREYSLIKTERFGETVMMEVGALLVGRIVNEHSGRFTFVRGEEKGHFEFGGSTVILLLRKDRVVVDEEILKASAAGEEYSVRAGQRIGTAVYSGE